MGCLAEHGETLGWWDRYAGITWGAAQKRGPVRFMRKVLRRLTAVAVAVCCSSAADGRVAIDLQYVSLSLIWPFHHKTLVRGAGTGHDHAKPVVGKVQDILWGG